ncbi:MAG TPA: transcription termination factor NusA [Candidatus Protoclostridium stercorigallinarum]|uniref:Transcription termination/antitermination protein NusA n=1 Tax=Candidatus Protoclostridium stercorigallinarum TaxID=2838741 RepID=A0A9D1PYD0_9FIRM|nr:transcription termination factor NusA [Candidatus Protoclostridium stercorigallinarum]
MNKEFFTALDLLEKEKKIPKEVFIEALESALALAYKKQFGTSKAIEVLLLPEKNAFKINAYLTVVEEVEDKDTQISLEDAKLIDRKYKVGDRITEEIDSKEFGRIVAQNAKQVIMQKLRDVENSVAYEELAEKEDDLLTVVVRRIDGKYVYVEIKKLEAVLAPNDQLPNDKFYVGERIKVYVKKIRQGSRGPMVQVSRTAPGFVRKLFEAEVPEIKSGQVVIKGLVREPGYRTKMAVYSEDPNIDAVGACVGNRGLRVSSIVAELGGEKIEIIPWCEDVLEFIARALSPAKVIMVEANEEERNAKVIVKDDMLSLAIGKDGQNARLAARLTNWKIDVRPYSAYMKQKEEEEAAEAAAAAEEEAQPEEAPSAEPEDTAEVGEEVTSD